MGREIYVIFFKKMACKTRGLPMEGDYEKNRPKKRGEGGNITLIKNPAREKKKPSRENSQNSAREKKNSTRENLSNTARENRQLPVKMFKKVGVKVNFHP